MDFKSLFSKKTSLALIAIIIGALAILYNLRGKGIILPPSTTINAMDQDNASLRIYDDTTATDTSIVKEEFPEKKLPF